MLSCFWLCEEHASGAQILPLLIFIGLYLSAFWRRNVSLFYLLSQYYMLCIQAEKKARIRNNKLEQGAAKVAEELQKYDPQSDPNATGDPYKTLFVARLNYEMSEHKIKREFEAYGPIKRVSTCGKFLCRWSYCTLVRFFSHFKMQTIVGQNCGEQFMAHFMFLWKVFAISGVIMCLCCAISDLEFPESCTYLFSLWVLKIFMQMFFLMKIGKHLFCIFSHCLVNMVLVFYLNSSFRSYWLFALFHTSENTLFALKYFTVNLLWVLYFFLRL